MNVGDQEIFKNLSRVRSQYSILPAFLLGVQDAVNPCMALTILVLLFLLSKYSTSVFESVKLLSIFVVGTMITIILSVFGLLDYLSTIKYFEPILKCGFLLFSMWCVVIGCVLFYDWTIIKKDRDAGRCRLKWPTVISKSESTSVKLGFRIGFQVFCCALIFGLFSSYWPKNYYLFMMIYTPYLSSEYLSSAIILAAYTLGYLLTLFLVYFLFYSIAHVKINDAHYLKKISMMKVIFASLFISIGISTSYVFIALSKG